LQCEGSQGESPHAGRIGTHRISELTPEKPHFAVCSALAIESTSFIEQAMELDPTQNAWEGFGTYWLPFPRSRFLGYSWQRRKIEKTRLRLATQPVIGPF